MKPSLSTLISICLILNCSRNLCKVNGLLFPQYTVMQIVAAVSWPIVDPDRKAFMNVGFQFNYNMPYNMSSFYDPMYWSSKRDLSDSSGALDDTQTVQSDHDKNKTKRNVIDGNELDWSKYHNELNSQKDISAGELYKSLEVLLVDAGYHETCLLKSVCEVSRHPFHIDDGQEDLLTEILQFVLTPSTHQGFQHNEHYLKERYEAAEDIGRMGGDCDIVYADCDKSIIDKLSYLSGVE